MTAVYSNTTGVPLSVAVFLATDHYDHEPNTISATGLLRATRQIVLTPRVPHEDKVIDISGLLKSRMGTAVHDGIERAWKGNYVQAMTLLGYPKSVIDRVVINPDPDDIPEGAIPVYMEQRAYRTIDGVTVSGKYDFIAEGRVEDFKTTGTFSWGNKGKDLDYQMQGSIYRWLNPKIVTAGHMAVQLMFTDWMPGRAATDPNYPSTATKQKLIPLLSLDDTEDFIRQKLRTIEQYRNADESELPPCNDHELWRKAPAFKYYKNPDKRARSTKNFDNAAEAYTRLSEDGSVGVVVEVPGEVIACKYCAAFSICSQKDGLIADGSLQL